jgi:hypothetical protein
VLVSLPSRELRSGLLVLPRCPPSCAEAPPLCAGCFGHFEPACWRAQTGWLAREGCPFSKENLYYTAVGCLFVLGRNANLAMLPLLKVRSRIICGRWRGSLESTWPPTYLIRCQAKLGGITGVSATKRWRLLAPPAPVQRSPFLLPEYPRL